MGFCAVKVWGDNRRDMWSYGMTFKIPDDYGYMRSGNGYATRMVKSLAKERRVPVFIHMRSNGNNHSSIVGYYAPGDVVEEVSERAESTEEKRGLDRKRSEERYIGKAKDRLLEMYPSIPVDDLGSVLKSFKVRSGRVGRAGNIDLNERIIKAATAHVRHRHTQYETMLEKAREKAFRRWEFWDDDIREERVHKRDMCWGEVEMAQEKIRDMIRPRINEILEKWSSGGDQGVVDV